jgi:hypothetical protein
MRNTLLTLTILAAACAQAQQTRKPLEPIRDERGIIIGYRNVPGPKRVPAKTLPTTTSADSGPAIVQPILATTKDWGTVEQLSDGKWTLITTTQWSGFADGRFRFPLKKVNHKVKGPQLIARGGRILEATELIINGVPSKKIRFVLEQPLPVGYKFYTDGELKAMPRNQEPTQWTTSG